NMGTSTLGKAASLDALLNECIHAFDDNGQLQANLLPRNLLMMHRWYVTSSELSLTYPTYRDCSSCHHLYRYWIVTFPAEFNLDLGLIQITEEFRDVAAQLGCEEHFKFLDISTM
uniref:N-terminal Ras-GEF domain-containing protein n=1 Tax=Labrus bergylta TaxID=56723 RepID=A0A3Q3LD97_9LABR